MAKDLSLGVNIFGKDVSASKTLKNIGKSASETGGKFTKMKDVMMGVLSAHILEKLGAEAVKFAKESLTAFVDVGKEVKKVQRITGASVEDASRLRFAFMETGLSVDKAQVSMKKFATSVNKNSKEWKALGISQKDASGKTKSFNDLLLDTAEKFKGMPDGIKKTATAVGLFGRSGLDMLPFLNKGREGLMELEAEATKYGLVLTKDNMKAVQESVMSHRELHAAVQGLQFQIGARLTPVLTKATVAFTTIFPILLKYVEPAFKAIQKILAPVIVYLKSLYEHVFKTGGEFVKAGSTMNRFKDILKNVGIIFRAFKELLGSLLPVVRALWDFIIKYLAPVLLFVLDYAFKIVSAAIKTVVTAVRFLIIVLRDLVGAARWVGRAIAFVFRGIMAGVKLYINSIITMVNTIVGLLNKIHIKFPSWVPKFGGKEFGLNLPKIPMLANGGIVNKPTLAMIGEAGPEAVVPLKKGLANGITIINHIQGSVISQKDLSLQVRNDIAQILRRKGVPISVLGL